MKTRKKTAWLRREINRLAKMAEQGGSSSSAMFESQAEEKRRAELFKKHHADFRGCKDDSCDASHCPKCGGHKLGWYTEGLCDQCQEEEFNK